LYLDLAAAASQERAAAFQENLEARRRILSVGPGENKEEKQYQGRDDSSGSHIPTLHHARRITAVSFPAEALILI
jgi:hypothetical protein